MKLSQITDFLGRHKYGITILFFGCLIGFLDENNLIRRMGYAREIHSLEKEIVHYRKSYEQDTKRLEELNSDPQKIEQIAREKYFMKKPNEDVFVFDE